MHHSLMNTMGFSGNGQSQQKTKNGGSTPAHKKEFQADAAVDPITAQRGIVLGRPGAMPI